MKGSYYTREYINAFERIGVSRAEADSRLDEIFDTLTRKSGLLGVSGVGKDLRYIMDAARKGSKRAALAVDMFVESILHYIGAYAAKMGGIDNLVFTGGIGENSVYVREQVCSRLAFMGLAFDAEANRRVSPEATVNEKGVNLISREKSRVHALVIPANEEIIVARRTYEKVSQE